LDSGCNPATYASIDIGSHTIRLLVARRLGDALLVPLLSERRVTRLAKGFHEGQTLRPSQLDLSTRVLEEYRDCMARFGVKAVACGATGVVRKSKNGLGWLLSMGEVTGIRGRILSEEREAFLSAKGILGVLPAPPERVLCFDLGGSTTEFLLMDARQGHVLWSSSVFVGAATITEKYLPADSISSRCLSLAGAAVREALSEKLPDPASMGFSCPDSPEGLLLVGTAGTVTTLGAMFLGMEPYEPYRVNGLELAGDWICRTLDDLAGLPVRKRKGIPGLEEGREDIILGGTLIVREILHWFEKKTLTVSDAGLLEGLLFRLIEEDLGWSGDCLRTPLTWGLQER